MVRLGNAMWQIVNSAQNPHVVARFLKTNAESVFLRVEKGEWLGKFDASLQLGRGQSLNNYTRNMKQMTKKCIVHDTRLQ